MLHIKVFHVENLTLLLFHTEVLHVKSITRLLFHTEDPHVENITFFNTALVNISGTQAALLAQRYKLTKRVGRLRPSNLGEMKQVALGLLPDDLDDIIKKPDDVFDIAEELKDIQDDLTSGQVIFLF